jgi:hypothetical protein
MERGPRQPEASTKMNLLRVGLRMMCLLEYEIREQMHAEDAEKIKKINNLYVIGGEHSFA